MTQTQDTYRVYVAHGDEHGRSNLSNMIRRLGHDVELETLFGSELYDRAIANKADIMVVSRNLRDGDGIDTLVRIAEIRPAPSIVVAAAADTDGVEKAMQDHVMSYLVEPVGEDDLRPALYLSQKRFAYFYSLEKQVQTLEERLESRKIIERAKGILLSRGEINEQQAHRKLQSLARQRRTKIELVAQLIINQCGPIHESANQNVKEHSNGQP